MDVYVFVPGMDFVCHHLYFCIVILRNNTVETELVYLHILFYFAFLNIFLKTSIMPFLTLGNFHPVFIFSSAWGFPHAIAFIFLERRLTCFSNFLTTFFVFLFVSTARKHSAISLIPKTDEKSSRGIFFKIPLASSTVFDRSQEIFARSW